MADNNNLRDLVEKTRAQAKEKSKATDPISKLVESTRVAANNKGKYGPSSIGYNTPLGDSRFDKDFLPDVNWDKDLNSDIEDFRSRSQGNLEKAAKGLGRVVNKVGTELVKIPGYVGGGLWAIGNEAFGDGEGSMDLFVNNAWIRNIEGYENTINQEVLPVYIKNSVKNGNLWDNISSIDFWANEGADGLAFMLAMMVPGYGISKLGLGAKLAGNIGKTEKGLELLTKIDKAAKVLGLESTAGAIDLTTSTLVNTVFEAGSEANSAMKGIERLQGETDEEYNLRRGEVGQNVFLANMGILMIPNAILNKNLFGMRSQKSRLNKFKISDGEIARNVEKIPFYKKATDFTMNVLGPNILREGFFEEGMQSTVEEYFKHNNDWNAAEIFKTYLDVLGTVEGQKAVFLGGLFGTIAGSGGEYLKVKGDEKQDNKIIEAFNSSINFYETALGGFLKKDPETGKMVPDLKKLEDSAYSTEHVQKLMQRMEVAKELGDESLYKVLRDNIDTSIATTFARAGQDGLDILRQRLEESEPLKNDVDNFNEKFNKTVKPEDNINKIMSKAEEVLNDLRFVKEYNPFTGVVKKTKENADTHASFMNKLENTYLQMRSQKRRVNEILSEVGREIDGLDENDPVDNVFKAKAEAKKQQYEEHLDYINSVLNDLFNKKKQREAFEKYSNKVAEIEELEKEAKEKQKKEETPQQKAEKSQKTQKIKKQHQAEKEVKKEKSVAKQKNNKFYDALDELFNNHEAYDLDKDPQSDVVGNITDTDKHHGLLKEFIPELDPKHHFVNISKEVDEDNVEVYKISIKDNYFNDVVNYEVQRAEEIIEEDQPKPIVIEDNINNNDEQGGTQEENVLSSTRSETEELLKETKSKDIGSVKKKHVKLVNSSDENMTSKLYKEYRLNPKNKKGETVTFKLGNPGDNLIASKALVLFQGLRDGTVSELTKESYNLLIRSLPIKVLFDEAGEIYTHLFMEDGSGKFKLDEKGKELRKNIIDNAIKTNNQFKVTSTIKYQHPGAIQNDIVDNKITDIKTLENIDDINFLYSDTTERLLHPNKEVSSDFNAKKRPGQIYLSIPMANGRPFPLKLNVRRVNSNEADLIIAITESFIDPNFKEFTYKTKYNQWRNDVALGTESDNVVKDLAKALDINYNDINISDIMRALIFEGNTDINRYAIAGDTVTIGPNQLNIKEFKSNNKGVKGWLTKNKNRNVITSKLDEKPYKQYIIDNVVTTDLKTGVHPFEGNTDIYIDSNVTPLTIADQDNKTSEVKTPSKSETVSKKVKALKKTTPSKRIGDIKKSVDKMKKDKDQNSDTIC